MSCSLTLCSLSWNQISDEGARELAAALQVNQSLQTLKWVKPFMSYFLRVYTGTAAMVVYSLNWCSSTSAVHGWFWLKLLKCMVQFNLVPKFSVGGENKSLVSTVCACASIPRNLGRSGTIALYLYNRDFHNMYLLLHRPHIFWPVMKLFWLRDRGQPS